MSGCACALHAHTTELGRRAGAPGARAPLRARRLRRPRGHRPLAPERGSVEPRARSSLPSVELNCILPGDRDGHVLGFGIEREPDRARGGATRTSRATADWIVGARRRRVPRAPVLDRRHARQALELPPNVAGIEVFNAGLRARGRARPLVRPLGRAARGRPALSRRSRPTTATIPASTPTTRGRGCAPSGRRRGVLDALRHGTVLRQHRPADPRRRGAPDGEVDRALQPVPLGHARLRARRAARRSTPAGSATVTARTILDDDDRRTRRRARGSTCPATRRFVRVEVVDAVRPEGVDEPAWASRSRAGGPPRERARRGRRSTCS